MVFGTMEQQDIQKKKRYGSDQPIYSCILVSICCPHEEALPTHICCPHEEALPTHSVPERLGAD